MMEIDHIVGYVGGLLAVAYVGPVAIAALLNVTTDYVALDGTVSGTLFTVVMPILAGIALFQKASH